MARTDTGFIVATQRSWQAAARIASAASFAGSFTLLPYFWGMMSDNNFPLLGAALAAFAASLGRLRFAGQPKRGVTGQRDHD